MKIDDSVYWYVDIRVGGGFVRGEGDRVDSDVAGEVGSGYGEVVEL